MLDVRAVREDPEAAAAALARRGVPRRDLDRLLVLDDRRRQVATARDDIRSRINALSKEVGRLRRDGDEAAAETARAESRKLGDQETALATEADEVSAELRDLLLVIPNLPHASAPDGDSDADNPVLRVVGYDPDGYEPHQQVPHWEIGDELGILDNQRAAKLSGAMFTMPRRGGATLARALCQHALDANADAFEEVRPPSLVSTETLTATGQLPKFADDAYAIERDDLWAIPTAEAPLTSMAAGEILTEAELPTRLMACTPCYRREAGAAGRDTRGMLRTHEFDKVELFAYATPTQAPGVLDELIARAEGLIASLGLAYRIVEICAGDMGQSHHRSFDLEVWATGSQRWLEVSSLSWLGDYQARRADIRYRPSGAKGTAMVHTLNGSALAVPRVWAALVETHRRPDGSVAIPEVLWPYMRGTTELSAAGG